MIHHIDINKWLLLSAFQQDLRQNLSNLLFEILFKIVFIICFHQSTRCYIAVVFLSQKVFDSSETHFKLNYIFFCFNLLLMSCSLLIQAMVWKYTCINTLMKLIVYLYYYMYSNLFSWEHIFCFLACIELWREEESLSFLLEYNL